MSYEEHVLKHFGEPYHKGPLLLGQAVDLYFGQAASVVCGDDVSIEARIEDDTIIEIWWQGEGCCFSQAASSMLVQYAEGRTVDDMRDYRDDELLTLFQAECPAARRDCVLVALRALRNLLETYPC